MGIRIITESSSDITQEEARELGVTVLPIPIQIGEESYLDGITLNKNRFYELLIEEDEIPKTSQITPFAYEEAIHQAIDAGDDVIVITLSSQLSGCYRNAVFAAGEFEGHVRVIDSATATFGQRILVERALQLISEGHPFMEIADRLEKEKKSIRVIALVNTLEYLRKGGRISAVAAAAGSLLGIKPVIAVIDGKVVVLGKARGSKSGNNMLIDQVLKNGGIDFTRPICLGYSGLSDRKLQKYIQDSAPLYEGKTDNLPIVQLGSTIGTYAGADAVGFAWFAKKPL